MGPPAPARSDIWAVKHRQPPAMSASRLKGCKLAWLGISGAGWGGTSAGTPQSLGRVRVSTRSPPASLPGGLLCTTAHGTPGVPNTSEPRGCSPWGRSGDHPRVCPLATQRLGWERGCLGPPSPSCPAKWGREWEKIALVEILKLNVLWGELAGQHLSEGVTKTNPHRGILLCPKCFSYGVVIRQVL